MKNAGRIDVVCNYLKYCKDVRGYMTHDDSLIILALLGSENSDENEGETNETEEKINETEEMEVETE